MRFLYSVCSSAWRPRVELEPVLFQGYRALELRGACAAGRSGPIYVNSIVYMYNKFCSPECGSIQALTASPTDSGDQVRYYKGSDTAALEPGLCDGLLQSVMQAHYALRTT